MKVWRSRSWILPALLAIGPSVGAAQRTIETHSISDPEGALMGYYSALLVFAPDGAPAPAKAWKVDLTANLGYVPPLSVDQRTAGRDKPESTNLTPVFGYPFVRLWLPDQIAIEAGYTPPFDVNGATPHVYAFGASVLAATIGTVQLVPRVTYTGGYIEAPITCNSALATSADFSFRYYYEFICHSMESQDRFEPNQWALELDAAGSWSEGKILPFGAIGVTRYQSTFDIRVQNPSGGYDTDHPILKMDATRGYGTLGATWVTSHLLRLSGSLYWAPGSVFTGRVAATFRLNDR